MAFDRSKYLGGSRKAQAVKGKTAEKFERRGGVSATRTYHYVKEGRNVFRIAPPHHPTKSAYEPSRTATLECMKPIYKDGELQEGQSELGRKKIFSAMQHHTELSKLGVKGDPIELYVSMVKDIAWETIKDKDERRKFLSAVNGFRGRDGKWVWGIEPKTEFIAWAWNEDSELGRVGLSNNWMKDIDRLSEELEEGGEPLDIDPFSNPVEGYPLIITRSKNDAGKTEYIVERDIPSRLKKETWEDFFKRTEITDAQLEELDKCPSLESIYVNTYKLKDFEFAMDGLKRFDEKNGYGILDMDEFNDAIVVIMDILEADEAARNSEETDTADGESDKEVVESKVIEPKKEATKKVAPKKVAPKKKASKPVGPTAEEMIDKVASYITDVYGEEYHPQIPEATSPALIDWFKIANEEEVNGDLPLVAVEDFNVETTEPAVEEAVAPEPEAEPDEVTGDDETDKLRKQMEALRSGRR